VALGSALARRIFTTPPVVTAAAGTIAYPGAAAVANSRMAVGIRNRRAAAWQEDAWAYFDTIGAAKYAARYVGNAFARLRFVAAVADEDGANPTPVSAILEAIEDPEDHDGDNGNTTGLPEALLRQAQSELGRIKSVVDGQGGILRDFGVNLTVAGDCNLVGIPPTPGTLWEQETWDVYSVTQIVEMDPWPDGQRRWGLRAEGASLDVELPYGAVVQRIYSPHQKRKELADSPFRGILDDLEELALLKRAIRSIAKSRVGTSGMLLVPTEITDALKIIGGADENAASPFVADLVKHLTVPLSDEGSASNVVPHILEGSAEHLKEVRHLPFVRQLEDVFIKLREEKLRDIAVGLDLPPEVLLGVGDVNHWGSFQVKEETYKAHIEPPATLTAAQMAAGILRPILATASAPEVPAAQQRQVWPQEMVDRIIIMVDGSDLVDRPDQSADALNLHQQYALSDEALRRYTGFTEDDAPSPEEVADRIERERLIHARGALPEQIPPGDVDPRAPNAPDGGMPPMPDQPPTQSPPPERQGPQNPAPTSRTASASPARPSRTIGQRLTALDVALQARIAGAAEQAVRRAIERVGARITSKAAKDAKVAQVARNTSKMLVAATLGRAVVASLDVDDTDLLEGDLSDFADTVDEDVADTRRKAVALLVGWLQANGRTVSDASLAELDVQAATDRVRGRQVLLTSLVRYARSKLYELDAQPDLEGEGVAAGRIPPGVLRVALAAYGGQDVVETDVGYQVDRSDQPADLTVGGAWGVAAGNTLLDFGAGQGALVEGWTWLHGSPAVPYPPHEALDGQTFTGTDEGSAGGYSVGDHNGCTCWSEPALVYVGDSTG
jgi:hypothetical protein